MSVAPQAATCTKISPGPGMGEGRSSPTSRRPNSRTTIARIVAPKD